MHSHNGTCFRMKLIAFDARRRALTPSPCRIKCHLIFICSFHAQKRQVRRCAAIHESVGRRLWYSCS